MKTCSKCATSKPFTSFHKDASRPDGLKPWCAACCKRKALDYYHTNKAGIADRKAARNSVLVLQRICTSPGEWLRA